MLLLALRSDKPEAELGIYEDQTRLAYEVWPAHRLLAETIHQKITSLLQTVDKTLAALEGIIVYQGPGSFTGLRIGITVANTLADSLSVPIIAGSGEHWIDDSILPLLKGENAKLVVPEYGSLPHLSVQKK